MIFTSWHDLIIWAVIGLIALLGSPITQGLKTWISKFMGIDVAGRLALGLTLLVSLGLSALEMWLSGNLQIPTQSTFPAWFTGVFTASTIYYKILSAPPASTKTT